MRSRLIGVTLSSLLLFLLLQVTSVAGHAQTVGGTITGRVTFSGTPPKRRQISMSKDPVCAKEHKSPVYYQDGAVEPDGSLPYAFVYIQSGLGSHSYAPPKKPAEIVQAGCMYDPHVFGVMAGQPIEIFSQDPTTHNIHFVARINHDWNHTQLPGTPPMNVTFRKPEIMIPIVCNQHPWMKAYVGVMANPFFAVTGRDGKFAIKGLPPGDYTLAVWTATFGTQHRNVHVRPNQSVAENFVFGGP